MGEFTRYREAKALAAEIAQRDERDADVVFSDAMHVAAALALEDLGIAYSKASVAWMFERVGPGEVHEVLRYRRDHREDYVSLPSAGLLDEMKPAQIETARMVAERFSSEQLNAFFFGHDSGCA